MKVKEIPLSLTHSWRLRNKSIGRLLASAKPEVPVIVSLTSIPSRLQFLPLVIRGLLDQSVRPEKIVLWLHRDLQQEVPEKLKELTGEKFEIRFTKGTYSHRKLVHALSEFPGVPIVTCDDDFIYRKQWLEWLYEEHLRHPGKIIANQVREIRFDAKGKLLPYTEWIYDGRCRTPEHLLAIGAEGVLYPPGCLDERVSEERVFLELAPKADDLWFKAMALLKGTEVHPAHKKVKPPIPIWGSQKESLKHTNITQDRNRLQWQALKEHFGFSGGPPPNVRTEIDSSLAVLGSGGLLLYPTDTVWGIGCDATDPKAVEQVYALKERNDSKALICLASDLDMVAEYADVPEAARSALEKAQRPTTIIYKHPRDLAPNLIADDDTVAIRIASDAFCKELIHLFGKPIVSTSANPAGAPTPKSFDDIDTGILKGVDYIVNLSRDRIMDTPSRILKIEEDGSLRVIRD